MAIMLAIATGFLQYAAHCLQMRYAVGRICLTEALGVTADEGTLNAVMRLLNEVDTAKEMLNDGFGTLLACKFGIDCFNVVLAVYVCLFRFVHRNQMNIVQSFLDIVFFETPIVLAVVLMVRVYQAVGDEVSESIGVFSLIQEICSTCFCLCCVWLVYIIFMLESLYKSLMCKVMQSIPKLSIHGVTVYHLHPSPIITHQLFTLPFWLMLA